MSRALVVSDDVMRRANDDKRQEAKNKEATPKEGKLKGSGVSGGRERQLFGE